MNGGYVGSPGWRLQIRHRTGMQYAGLVGSSYNEARMSPTIEPRQSVLDSRITVWPSARTFAYRDYWGTTVTAFDVQVSHESLEVIADATVETLVATPARSNGIGWDDLDRPAVAERWPELLLPTPRTALDEELTELATSMRAAFKTPDEAARAVCELVRQEITYASGTTGVQTDAVQVWRQRLGVCQDLSHLAIALLRTMGLPARYVSGYLHPTPNAPLGQPVAGQSHAWVEWWTGDWHAYDPTNGVGVGERHVVVGRGRDYGDVPPLKGVYAGPPNTSQTVEVTLTRVR
ncbi:transglutaminase-like putative cysteine protease [Allocatelliglobosispora scoriae]|uniref:Transglutaminase-like putative cysteine protease n=1 Tax=Allocatelliglobosispora scoriae TaxID=643052 RepID=A0A841BZB1_9ACTN|nr:transglutaminase family protein [Allocatelliglobosispora scoriae]MBB5872828.1 transglutaminase-like putative cysteine protease [Allocatelliglobosispora scoriae]